jgi:hypothetical protein
VSVDNRHVATDSSFDKAIRIARETVKSKKTISQRPARSARRLIQMVVSAEEKF